MRLRPAEANYHNEIEIAKYQNTYHNIEQETHLGWFRRDVTDIKYEQFVTFHGTANNLKNKKRVRINERICIINSSTHNKSLSNILSFFLLTKIKK